jgi:hypothetical protein
MAMFYFNCSLLQQPIEAVNISANFSFPLAVKRSWTSCASN